MVDIKRLADQYRKEYEFLYAADVAGKHVAGYDEALADGERMLAELDEDLVAFARYRQDGLTSDRELAAFAFAISEVR